MQLTNITAGSAINVSYNYTAGANNGKIASMSDAISGETVTYQYDSLNRLISASGSTSGSNTWTQTQAYDGFGNLSGRTGTGAASGTTISTPAVQSTNQLSGYSYDANGNLISSGYTYDPENRITFANNGGVGYSYDGQNKRVWQATCNSSLGSCGPGPNFAMYSETITMFGADSKQLASYAPVVSWTNTQTQLTITFQTLHERTYFGGKLVGQFTGSMQAVVQDRLGSVGKYYPYGEERNSPQLPNDQVKFATYTRDSATGNDYADQRYYSSALGRFVTPDPYRASARHAANPGAPQSWNRYSYAGSDPVNHNDPSGRDWCDDYDLFCFATGFLDNSTVNPLGIDFNALAAQIAAQVQQGLSSPQGQANIQMIPLYTDGLVTNWDDTSDGQSFTNVQISGDYSQFITYLQGCGCSTVNLGPLITDVKTGWFIFNSLTVLAATALDQLFHGAPIWARTKIQGATPNSVETFPTKNGKVVRVYGPDGRAVRDIDYGDQAHSGSDPEVHDWNWSSGEPVREPGRPPQPGDIP